MSDKPLDVAMTQEHARSRAEDEFEAKHPRPELPPAPKPSRPGVVRADEAHLWIDVKAVDRWTPQAKATLYVVERKGGNDQRIEGELTAETIDAFIDELQRAKAELQLRQIIVEQAAKHDKAVKAWEEERTAAGRAAVAAWQKAQVKK